MQCFAESTIKIAVSADFLLLRKHGPKIPKMLSQNLVQG